VVTPTEEVGQEDGPKAGWAEMSAGIVGVVVTGGEIARRHSNKRLPVMAKKVPEEHQFLDQWRQKSTRPISRQK